MNVTSLTQEFLSLNLNSNLNSDSTQAFGVATSEEEFLWYLTQSFSSYCNWGSNGFSKPSLCFWTSKPPHGDVHRVFWEQRGVCSHCRHVTLPKQKGSCDYPHGELCLLLTWTVWHWEVSPGCNSLDEPLPSREMDLWGSQIHPLRNFLSHL